MNSFKRIAIVFVLLGGVSVFGYWSNTQFNQVLDDSFYEHASANLFYSIKKNIESASTSPETLEEKDMDDIDTDIGTTTQPISDALATSTVEFSYTFPKKGDVFYIGCAYPISWQSSTKIDLLGVSLVDAGTREVVGPIASGLAKENSIEKDLQNIEWKVGSVWPGPYYIKASNINGVQTEFRSDQFEINKMSENISTSEKEIICKGSGGLLSV